MGSKASQTYFTMSWVLWLDLLIFNRMAELLISFAIRALYCFSPMCTPWCLKWHKSVPQLFFLVETLISTLSPLLLGFLLKLVGL